MTAAINELAAVAVAAVALGVVLGALTWFRCRRARVEEPAAARRAESSAEAHERIFLEVRVAFYFRHGLSEAEALARAEGDFKMEHGCDERAEGVVARALAARR